MTKPLPHLTFFASILIEVVNAAYEGQQRETGRPRVDLMLVLEGILFILITGHTWRYLPREYGAFSTVHRYYQEWAKDGLFELMHEKAYEVIKQSEEIEDSVQILDGLERAGKNLKTGEGGFGYKIRGKEGIKISYLVDKNGVPLAADVCKAGISDLKRITPLLETMPSKAKPGALLIADKGYSGGPAKISARAFGFDLIVPKKNSFAPESPKVIKLLKIRHRIENALNRLMQHRRIDRCLDRTQATYKGWIYLAMSIIALGV